MGRRSTRRRFLLHLRVSFTPSLEASEGGANSHRSIRTYGGRGVKGFRAKSNHAIVHTGDFPRPPKAAECLGYTDEMPMGEPIRIIPFKSHSLDPTSYLDFGRTYTIDYGEKVCYFGRVAPEDLGKLSAQFDKCSKASQST